MLACDTPVHWNGIVPELANFFSSEAFFEPLMGNHIRCRVIRHLTVPYNWKSVTFVLVVTPVVSALAFDGLQRNGLLKLKSHAFRSDHTLPVF